MRPSIGHCDEAFCPQYHHAVELIGRRWTGAILRAMLHGASRFSDLRAAVPDLSDKMLSHRLKELEAEGIVKRSVFPETPVRIEYRVTDKGSALERVLSALEDWADTWDAERPIGQRRQPAASRQPRQAAASRAAAQPRTARPGVRARVPTVDAR
jgi:DNA-binding HxlR family transcriptional regulator